MLLYRIRDWYLHFENNRTKELLKMTWVPIPNKHDGDGYTEIMDHPNGMAHFGAWCLIVQVASKCDPRGSLIRSGLGDPAGRCGGKIPHDFESLARVTRANSKVFEAALPRLVKIGWVECIDFMDNDLEIPQEGAVLGSQEGAALSFHSIHSPSLPVIEGGNGGKQKKLADAEIPESLRTAMFADAWAEWKKYKAERKETMVPTGERNSLSRIAKFGPERAAAAIKHSMSQNWQGIYEEKEKNYGKPKRTECPEPARNTTVTNYE